MKENEQRCRADEWSVQHFCWWDNISIRFLNKNVSLRLQFFIGKLAEVLYGTDSLFFLTFGLRARFTWRDCMQSGMEGVGHLSSRYILFSSAAFCASSSNMASPICSSKVWQENEVNMNGICFFILLLWQREFKKLKSEIWGKVPRFQAEPLQPNVYSELFFWQ